MIATEEIRIPARGVRSLVWHDDTLVDWVGSSVFTPAGEARSALISYAYVFDAAVGSPSGEFSAIYTRHGTKALILRRGELVREINRSYYFADAYEFPIALIRLQSGREVVVHCPDRYNQLEIDDLATGERLTAATSREPIDFFHSRLAASLDGTRLVSAGWVWHPFDSIQVYDVAQALASPGHLDGDGLGIDVLADGSSAAFLPDGRLAVDLVNIDDDDEAGAPGTLMLFDPDQPHTPKVIHRTEQLGTMLPVGAEHLLGLYDYPRLFDLRTGEIVRSWPHISSGKQTSSIIRNAEPLPPIALDAVKRRCAVADAEGINVLTFLDV